MNNQKSSLKTLKISIEAIDNWKFLTQVIHIYKQTTTQHHLVHDVIVPTNLSSKAL